MEQTITPTEQNHVNLWECVEAAIARKELIIQTILSIQKSSLRDANPPTTDSSWQAYEADIRNKFEQRVSAAFWQRHREISGGPGYYSSDPEVGRLQTILEALEILQPGKDRVDLTPLRAKLEVVAREIANVHVESGEEAHTVSSGQLSGDSLDSAGL